ncbi:glycoside hydrolase family 95 protein [Lacrimispora amygdalina]|uniref:Glycoside hydrolase family 95 protein n=1 Tax=Lacrimispora amygdalina TaxID=253257 RepID=A0A3E2ND13_9FIRM|nr:glycoside hydrolase family 95 protein [Clostridium indicum]RFZ78864.1 glycoside hydrolase family 95 protein [Clostridium indicum]
MKLFYAEPAGKWEETLPIGNGSLGAMIWGNGKRECLGLNEESLWSGYRHDKNNHEAFPYLEQCRRLVEQEKYEQAEELIRNHMLGEYNESYLPLGNLYIDFDHSEDITDYSRALYLDQSVSNVSYRINGVKYSREYFASYPARAVFIKLECDKNAINALISFESQVPYKAEYEKDGIKISGKCPEHVDPSYVDDSVNPIIQGEKGMEFHAGLHLLSCDGEVSAGIEGLRITGASNVIMAFHAVKEPVFDHSQAYEKIREQHISDYKSIYDKAELYLGEQPDIPTNVRLQKLRNGEKDNALYALYFQYGRYLLISSSREGSLPANLQGIWSWQLRAPWSCNWTTNINAQMNYWLAQSCNLKECLQPYFEFVKRICEEGKKTAEVHYQCRGFVHHHNADYWCSTNPVGMIYGEEKGEPESVTWSMWPMGGAWLTSELFKHYEYNPDRKFLEQTVYPILKEAALFLVDWLYLYKDRYVTCPSTSPENKYKVPGSKDSAVAVAMSTAMDLAIIREVFGNFQKTCEILGIDDEVLQEISERLSKLTPFKIGTKGQLLEWHKEFDEVEPGHRHVSHLYGLFPSELFEGDEDLTEACRTSLLLRLANGGGYTGWSCAWIINLFAALEDSDHAYEYLKTLLTRSTYDNLWCAHPPFQIDGNFGGTAGIANMLVQERNGKVKILPALPSEFENGYVKGLRIKNGKTVDIKWSNGKLEDYKIY